MRKKSNSDSPAANKNKGENARRKIFIKSEPFIVNRGLQIKYAKTLRELCRPMILDASAAVMKFYRKIYSKIALDEDGGGKIEVQTENLGMLFDELQDRYNTEFDLKSENISRAMVMEVLVFVNKSFSSKTKNILPHAPNAGELLDSGYNLLRAAASSPGLVNPEMEAAISAAIIENVNLIKSIPTQYFDRIAGAATRAMQYSGSPKRLMTDLKKYAKMTIRRANDIAVDQTNKTYTALNLRKFKQAGITRWEWLHTGGSVHPREHHLKKYPYGLNGGIFTLDNPPVIDPRTGERGFPSQLPYCRCTMCAVVTLEDF